MSRILRTVHPAPTRVILNEAWNGEAHEFTGHVENWEVQWRNDWESLPRMEIRFTLLEPTNRTVPQRSHTSLWDRFVVWLQDCPLSRQPEKTVYPVI